MAKIYNFTNKKYEEIPYHIRNNHSIAGSCCA